MKHLNKFGEVLNENNNLSLDRNEIDRIANILKGLSGVMDVDTSELEYDDDEPKFRNTNLRIIFDKLTINSFKSDGFNSFSTNADSTKALNHIDKKSDKLDDYLKDVERIKESLSKMKDVVKFIDTMRLKAYSNVNDYGFTIWRVLAYVNYMDKQINYFLVLYSWNIEKN